MAPMSVSATLAPLLPPPSKVAARSSARRAPANAASIVAAGWTALPVEAALPKEEIAGSINKVRARLCTLLRLLFSIEAFDEFFHAPRHCA
jgi:hypothetical protein